MLMILLLGLPALGNAWQLTSLGWLVNSQRFAHLTSPAETLALSAEGTLVADMQPC